MKLETLMKENIPFDDEDGLVNFGSNSVVPDAFKKDIIRQYNIREEAYSAFIEHRIKGDTNFWNPVKKLKFHSKGSQSKS